MAIIDQNLTYKDIAEKLAKTTNPRHAFCWSACFSTHGARSPAIWKRFAPEDVPQNFKDYIRSRQSAAAA